LFPAFDSGEDPAWIGGPDEGFWIAICFNNESVDGRLQLVD
jgi:hypothetical protein